MIRRFTLGLCCVGLLVLSTDCGGNKSGAGTSSTSTSIQQTTEPTTLTPQISLSSVAGGPGSRIGISVSNCPPLSAIEARHPSVFFHDSFNRDGGSQSGRGLRYIERKQGRSTVSASYVVQQSDSIGVGLFVVFCGGGQTADANFDVK